MQFSTEGFCMPLLRGLLLAILFAVELATIALAAWWAWRDGGFSGVIAAIVAVVALALSWGRYAAPRAKDRLSGAPLAVFMAIWFGVGAAALVAKGHPWWGLGFAVIVAGTKGLLAVTGVNPSGPAAVERQRPHVGQ
jgi:Protein of unknown function (DUF2568)